MEISGTPLEINGAPENIQGNLTGLFDPLWFCEILSYGVVCNIESAPGSHFNIRQDVLSWDLVKPRSREIGCLRYRIALKFDRHIGSSAANVPVKFQGDLTILNKSKGISKSIKA